MTERKHPEAFCLMEYASADGSEREVLWNSRDGVTPFIISSATSGQELTHTNWRADRYAPEHLPKVGDRIFVDLTEQRARYFAARQIESMIEHGYREELERDYASREAAVEDIAKGMLRPGAPDILVVTAGYLEELVQLRAAARTRITAVDLGTTDTTRVFGVSFIRDGRLTTEEPAVVAELLNRKKN